MEVDHASTDLLGILMINYNANHVPTTPINNTSSPYRLDDKGSKDIDKMAKTPKPLKIKRGCYNRKSSWTSTKVTSWTEDGHEWRKYGQKEILNAKHKRNYYRCIFKFDQGCQATKQVQKIEDEPTKYKITYHQYHTCKNLLRSPQIILDFSNSRYSLILLSFESNGINEKKQVEPNSPLKIEEKEHKEGYSYLDVTHNQSLSVDYNPSPDLMITQVPFGSVSLMSSRLEHEYVMSTEVFSPLFDMDHILEIIDFNEVMDDFSN